MNTTTVTKSNLNEDGVVETVKGLKAELLEAVVGDACATTHNALRDSAEAVEERADDEGWLSSRHLSGPTYQERIDEAEKLATTWHNAAMAWRAAERVRWELARLTEVEWTETDGSHFNHLDR